MADMKHILIIIYSKQYAINENNNMELQYGI